MFSLAWKDYRELGVKVNDLNYYIPNHQQLEALHQPPPTTTDLCAPICCRSNRGSSEERHSQCLILFRISALMAACRRPGLNSPLGDKGSPAWAPCHQGRSSCCQCWMFSLSAAETDVSSTWYHPSRTPTSHWGAY